MSIVQMQKVTISALREDRKAILEKLQAMGVMEVHPIENGHSSQAAQKGRKDYRQAPGGRLSSGGYERGIQERFLAVPPLRSLGGIEKHDGLPDDERRCGGNQ